MPVHNAAPFLDKSIASALNQSQTNELLLIDDKSTDNSLEICKKWEKYDSRVKVFINNGKKGAGAARNVGLQNAACGFIAFLDADDFYGYGRFKEDHLIFKKFPEVEAICNTVAMASTYLQEFYYLNGRYKNGEKIGHNKSNSIIKLNAFLENIGFHLNGLTIRRTIIDKIGIFDEELIQSEDIDFILRIVADSVVMSDDDTPKAYYVLHDNNSIGNSSQAVYSRRKLALKHFWKAIDKRYSFPILIKFFKDFMEYDFLMNFGKIHNFKKLFKLMLLPYFIYKITSKTDPPYDKTRKIHLS